MFCVVFWNSVKRVIALQLFCDYVSFIAVSIVFCVFVQLSVGSNVRMEVCAKDQTLALVQRDGWAEFARSVSTHTIMHHNSSSTHTKLHFSLWLHFFFLRKQNCWVWCECL